MGFPLNGAFLLALLGIKEGQIIETNALVNKCNLSPTSLARNLAKAHDDGLASLEGGILQVTRSQKLKLALTALKRGVDIEEVCKAAGWQEFEQLAEHVLQGEEYSTRTHFRFRISGHGHEVDIVAMRRPLIMSIECKRWKKSWQLSGIQRIVASHLLRTRNLCKVLCDHKDELNLRNWTSADMYPIVLMLSETPTRVEGGVPIVPIHRFVEFLAGFDLHVAEYSVCRCQL